MIEFDRSEIKASLWALAYCVATAVLFFRGVVFLPHQFQIPFDLEAYHRPLSSLIADTLREHGHLPWWNPYSYMGEPFDGNLTAATFYPPTIVVALLGNALYGHLPYWLIELQLVAHVALAGFGTYLFLRVLGVTVRAALAGAAIYQLGGFFASQTQHLGAMSTSAWLPFFLGSLYRLQERRNFRWVAISAIFLAFMILAGFPAAYLPVFVFGPLLFVFWLNVSWPQVASWRPVARPILLLGSAMLGGGLLSAVSWLPAYFVSAQSIARLRPPDQAIGGLTAEGLTSFVWPNLFGQLRGEYWLGYENFTMLYYYQGVVALVLLFGGISWLVRSARALPFLAGAGISLLWMLGTNSFASLLFYVLYPRALHKGIYAYCLLAYFSLFIAALCALALSAYEKGERRKLASSRPLLTAAFVLAILALVVCLGGVFATNGSPLPARASAAGGSLLFVSGWLGLCWVILRQQTKADIAKRYRVSAALCVVIILDLVSAGSHSRSNTWQGELPPTPPVVKFLHERLGEGPWYRVDTSDVGYAWQAGNALWRLPSANGFNAFELEETRVYRSPFSSAPDDRQYSLDKPDSPLLDLAGIRYIITSKPTMGTFPSIYQGEVNVFENTRAFPRFFLVGGVIPASDIVDAARKIYTREAAPSQVAIVSSADAQRLAVTGGPATSDALGKVEVIGYEPNEIRLRVDARRRAVLVAVESFWDEWKATEDGRPVPLVQADCSFRAVPVSAGVHEIRMWIAPRYVYAGGAISLLSLIVCVALILLGGGTKIAESEPEKTS